MYGVSIFCVIDCPERTDHVVRARVTNVTAMELIVDIPVTERGDMRWVLPRSTTPLLPLVKWRTTVSVALRKSRFFRSVGTGKLLAMDNAPFRVHFLKPSYLPTKGSDQVLVMCMVRLLRGYNYFSSLSTDT